MIDIILGNSFDDKQKINKAFTKHVTHTVISQPCENPLLARIL